MNAIVGDAVVLLHWPEEDEQLARLRAQGIPRLLMVSPGETPPIDPDPKTDWIRTPITDDELRARVAVLEMRAATAEEVPTLTGDGRLMFRGRWVVVPRLSEKLLTVLVARFGAVVPAADLVAAGWPDGSGGNDVLRGHLSKLRSQVSPLGLRVQGVRERGYVLHVRERPVVESSPQDSRQVKAR